MQHTPSENLQQNQTPLGNLLPPETKTAESANNPALFYTQEDDDIELHLPTNDSFNAQEAPFVLPFQSSTPIPTITPVKASATQGAMGQPSSDGTIQKHSLRLLKFLLIGGVVFFTMIGGGILLFAQSAPTPKPAMQATKTTIKHPTTKSPIAPGVSTQKKTTAPSPTGHPSPAPQPSQGTQNQGQTTPTANLPTPDTVPSAQRLSDLGWTQAGLSASDAIEALRTATTFTDREMSYDYRAIGTLAHHSGTLTSAFFLFTPGGQTRFAQNDVRVINNVLYEKIAQGKIIHQVVNAQAALVQLQGITVQGQVHLCAWINVSFSLFQSKLDPANGKRIDGLLTNATTGQPNRYQMAVVLVWVAPQNQGPDAPMGGTGWLVNTYALDATSPPILETSPSI
jgi:hypothetical protein